MSFDLEEIALSFSEATGGRREYFGSDGYSFRRLGKLENADLARLVAKLKTVRFRERRPEYHAAWMKAWRAANLEVARRRDAAKYEQVKADPARYARRLELNRERLRKYRADPAKRAARNADSLRRYHAKKAVAA